MPQDLTVTKSGDLIYTDYSDITVNKVPSTQIEVLIRLRGWRPSGVCSTSSGDLMVIMDSDDDEQTNVMRYSNSVEEQSIQFDNKGELLYSLGYSGFHITENKN